MNAQDYSAYVLSAYGIPALALLALGAFVLFDARRTRAELKRLEDGGLRRRSTRAS